MIFINDYHKAIYLRKIRKKTYNELKSIKNSSSRLDIYALEYIECLNDDIKDINRELKEMGVK